MFTAIIVDRFGQMREISEAIYDDRTTICFICGMTKQEVHLTKEDFDHHITVKHNMLHYIFYIDYLKTKKLKCPESLHLDEIQLLENIEDTQSE